MFSLRAFNSAATLGFSLLGLVLAACGAGTRHTPPHDDDAGVSVRLDGAGGGTAAVSCEPALDCTARGAVCGMLEDSRCGHVDCGACRWGTTDVGVLPSIRADASGLHAVFLESSGAPTSIRYASIASDGSITENQLIAPLASSTLERAPALAIDAGGSAHVAWAELTNGMSQVSYALRGVSGVTVAPVAAGHLPDVAVDGLGQALVVYQQEPVGALRVSTLDGADWSQAEIEPMGAGWPSIAVDGAGLPHVAYVAHPSGKPFVLRLASRDAAGGWSVEDVQSSVEVFAGVTLDLAYGADGEPRIALATQRPGACLLTRSAGVFNVTTLQPGLSRSDIALALGPFDQPHVSYFGDDGLMYATVARDGTLSQRLVSPQCDTGQTSIALDAIGSPHVLHSCASFAGQHDSVVGAYPASYFAACDAVVAKLCPLACDCDPTSECSYDGQGDGAHFGPASICPDWVRKDFCSSDKIDPQLLTDCERALSAGQGTCQGTSYHLPAACDPVLLGNN